MKKLQLKPYHQNGCLRSFHLWPSLGWSKRTGVEKELWLLSTHWVLLSPVESQILYMLHSFRSRITNITCRTLRNAGGTKQKGLYRLIWMGEKTVCCWEYYVMRNSMISTRSPRILRTLTYSVLPVSDEWLRLGKKKRESYRIFAGKQAS